VAVYRFEISRVGDHRTVRGAKATNDLHVHVYYNKGRGEGRLIGRYRIPGLEPLFEAPDLDAAARRELLGWLEQPQQLKKLQSALRQTLFDLDRVASAATGLGKVQSADGETFIVVRIPVSQPIDPRHARRSG
jgi:hypothetical protein